ncbi:unnamed protein product [Sphenostylis stenocarpa]|uniref:Uncharacterized protein n=1 Tax=Sphenostylis stenocarpa TaxID=92480 RepID=A0AA86SAA6_9FABA|nr:unnamed protein product [Sphenostylis stenocarpa]
MIRTGQGGPTTNDGGDDKLGRRPRDRFRERENGRSGNEGSTRGGGGSVQAEIPSTSSSIAPSPTIVLSGSRTFTGQHPTILQSRDRQDDTGSMCEENVDGSKDSGDTSSIGDPELVSAFEGPSSGYGSQRHSSRGSKSRQLGERRDRDNRREGKYLCVAELDVGPYFGQLYQFLYNRVILEYNEFTSRRKLIRLLSRKQGLTFRLTGWDRPYCSFEARKGRYSECCLIVDGFIDAGNKTG